MNTHHILPKLIPGLPYLLGLILGATLLTGSAQGFFPALPPTNRTNNLNQGSTPPPSPVPPAPPAYPPGGPAPPTPSPPQPGGQTPVVAPVSIAPPTMAPPPSPPGITGVPELDPGSLAGALGILISGTLMLWDRRHR